MSTWITAAQATALCLSLTWLGLALAGRPRRPLDVTWALFCGSIAMLIARELVGPDATPWYQLFGLGACLTCNGFWLVARSLFRTGAPFAAPHVAYVGLVALLIITARLGGVTPAPLAAINGEMLRLLSSAALVMALWEGMRGWRVHSDLERRMRTVFLGSYGACVAGAVILPAALDPRGTSQAGPLTTAVASIVILLVTQGLVAWRSRHPAGDDVPVPTSVPSSAIGAPNVAGTVKGDKGNTAPTHAEDAVLARALEHHMRTRQPYLQPDLKLGHLAQALDVGEYRISRAVRGPLNQRNVSRYINGYRLDHARRLLTDPACEHWSTLVIGLESGFGSLGAFHRAFRTAEGCTPGEYRARRGESALGSPTMFEADTLCREASDTA